MKNLGKRSNLWFCGRFLCFAIIAFCLLSITSMLQAQPLSLLSGTPEKHQSVAVDLETTVSKMFNRALDTQSVKSGQIDHNYLLSPSGKTTAYDRWLSGDYDDEPYDIDLDDYEPVEASVAFRVVKDMMASDYPDARFIGIYGFESAYPMDFFKPREVLNFAPEGRSYFWEFIYHDEDSDMLLVVITVGNEFLELETIAISSLPPGAFPVDFSEVQTVPDHFVESTVAFDMAMENGLDLFIDQAGSAIDIEIDYSLSSFYFFYDDVVTSESNPFWSLMVYAWGDWDGEWSERMVVFFVDAITGEFLGKSEDGWDDWMSAASYWEVQDVVSAHMADVDADARLFYVWGREEFTLPGAPYGDCEKWMFVYLNMETENVTLLDTYGKDVVEIETFHYEDIPEDERPAELDEIDFVGEVFLGNDQAVHVAMEEGLAELVEEFNEFLMSAEQELWAWVYVNYHLSRFHFHHPDIEDQDLNPFWEVRAELSVRDDDWNAIKHDHAIFFVDAVTGQLLGTHMATSAESAEEMAGQVKLHQNYPNPFNPVTTIIWEMDTADHVSLKVFDLLGQEMTILANTNYPAGVHSIPFDASGLSSGLYIYHLKVGSTVLTRKMTLLK